MIMATNEPEVSLDEAKALADQLVQQAVAAFAPTLALFAQWQQARAEQLAAAAERLKTTLGEYHPRVIALNQAVTATKAFQQVLSVEAVRAARRPVIQLNEWVVFGHLIDAHGNPVPGLRVRVFDRDRKYDDLLGDTTTDEFGDFAVKYHERDFAETGEALPDLYVMVSDLAGTLLFTSRDNVRFEAGRAEYFEIVLAAAPEAPPDRPAPSASKRTRSKPKAKTARLRRKGKSG
jgi:hypothetical protein